MDGGDKKDRSKNGIKDILGLLLIIAFAIVVYLVSQPLVLYLSRSREYYADTYSAYTTGKPFNLQSALAKLTYGLSLSSKESSGPRTLYIVDPQKARGEVTTILQKRTEYDLDRDGVLDERELALAMEKETTHTSWWKANDLFCTHPSTFSRILLLKKIEDELESGRFAGDIYRFI